MSAPTAKSPKIVTNLLPNHHFTRNLFLRNGTFYIRKMIDGKRFVKSLHTDDPYFAIHILKMWRISGEFGQVNNVEKFRRLNEILMSYQRLNVSEYITYKNDYKVKDRSMLLNDRYKQYVRPNILSTNKHELVKYDNMMSKMTKYLENRHDSEVLADPHILDGMIEYLSNMKTKSGTFLAKKTLHEYAKLFKRLFDRQSDRELVADIMNKAIKTYCKAVTKERQPLGEADFSVLFEAMNKLIYGDLDFVDEQIQMVSLDLQHTTDSKRKNRLYARIHNLNTIKKQPEMIYYAILLMMFSGSRVNAIATLRLSNIDIEEKTIEITKDEDLINGGDIRELNKHLKTEGSMRKLPIATFLIKMKFLDFVKAMKTKSAMSKDQFLFERVIKTKEGYRPNYINEAINEFLLILGLKPTKSTELLDCHSFKTTFVTWNKKKFTDKGLLKAITGNTGNQEDIIDNHYTKYSMKLTPSLMIEGINKISYPCLNVLKAPQKWAKMKQTIRANKGKLNLLSIPLLLVIHDVLFL